MADYFNPPTELPTVARPLHCLNWRDAQMFLKHDEVLFGLGDNLMFKNARHLDSEAEFNDMYSAYARGHLVSMVLYAMPKSVFVEHFGKEPKR